MEVNLIELVGKEFDGDVVGELSDMLGEPENKVQKAVGGLGPVLVTALANKASSGQGLADLFNMFKSGGFDGSQDLNLGSLVGGKGGGGFSDVISDGAPLVVSLLGDRRGGVTEWLASLAGIGPKSAASLLSLAAPVLLNLIGGQAKKSGGFNQATLGQLLGSQGAFLGDKVPDGLASALGITDLSKLGVSSFVAAPQLKHVPSSVGPQSKVESRRTWWLWLILALALAALAWWWFVGRGPADTINSQVSIVNDDGSIVCSAAVDDQTTSDALLKAVQAAFGESTACDITVDPKIKKPTWLLNADKIFAELKQPGAEFKLDGNAIRLGGGLSEADRTATLDELRSLFGADFSFSEIAPTQ